MTITGSRFDGCVANTPLIIQYNHLAAVIIVIVYRSAIAIHDFVDRDSEQSEPLDISFALDVEHLGTNLFRSSYLPYRTRDVFGGHFARSCCGYKIGETEFCSSCKFSYIVVLTHCDASFHPIIVARTPSLLVDYFKSSMLETSVTSFWLFLLDVLMPVCGECIVAAVVNDRWPWSSHSCRTVEIMT